MNFAEDFVLENDRILIEPLTMDHLSVLLPIALAHPDLLRYSPSPFGSEVRLKSYLQTALQGREKEERYAFAIYDKQQDSYIGSTSFGHYSRKDQRIEIGWTWIDKAAQGTGVNAHCKHLLLSYAFGQLALKRVEFRTDSRNMQSRKAMEKIGASYEGCLRSHTLMNDGHRRDTVFYSILKSEWKNAEKAIIEKMKRALN